MGLLRLLLLLMLLGGSAAAQSPTYGVGRTPTEEEIRAWDISISPTGEELPPGRGTPEEGELVYRRGCATCHGANGVGGSAPRLIKREAEPGRPPVGLRQGPPDSRTIRHGGLGLHQSWYAPQSRGDAHGR